jgi:hypothetical protein
MQGTIAPKPLDPSRDSPYCPRTNLRVLPMAAPFVVYGTAQTDQSKRMIPCRAYAN